jgi:hypothetical protein
METKKENNKYLIELSKETIEEIIKNSKIPEEAITELHKKVIGDEIFNSMEKLKGFVSVNENTTIFLYNTFKEKWGILGMTVYMNSGFSVDKELDDFICNIKDAIK